MIKKTSTGGENLARAAGLFYSSRFSFIYLFSMCLCVQ